MKSAPFSEVTLTRPRASPDAPHVFSCPSCASAKSWGWPETMAHRALAQLNMSTGSIVGVHSVGMLWREGAVSSRTGRLPSGRLGASSASAGSGSLSLTGAAAWEAPAGGAPGSGGGAAAMNSSAAPLFVVSFSAGCPR